MPEIRTEDRVGLIDTDNLHRSSNMRHLRNAEEISCKNQVED